jgi:hypothetical protein
MSEISRLSQGYGLTLQQASKAIEGLGISLEERSDFHQTFSTLQMENDRRMGNEKVDAPRLKFQAHQCAYRTTVRLALLEQLGHDAVQWGHQLVDFKETERG